MCRALQLSMWLPIQVLFDFTYVYTCTRPALHTGAAYVRVACLTTLKQKKCGVLPRTDQHMDYRQASSHTTSLHRQESARAFAAGTPASTRHAHQLGETRKGRYRAISLVAKPYF